MFFTGLSSVYLNGKNVYLLCILLILLYINKIVQNTMRRIRTILIINNKHYEEAVFRQWRKLSSPQIKF